MIKSFLHKLYPFLIIILSVIFSVGACAWAERDKKDSRLIGGPCQYKSYPGQATILSITATESSNQDKIKKYEVKFSFSPYDKITETFARVEGKTFHLYGNNFQYPDREFLISNDIRVGRVLEGSLQAITSGTCTPVLFDFPALRKEK